MSLDQEVYCIGGFSGGIDSQAAARFMLNRYGEERVILVNTDAGQNEHPLTTEHLKWYSENIHPVIHIDAIVTDIWGKDKTTIAHGYTGNEILTFPLLAKIKGRFPSRTAQFCTLILKLKPMKRWLESNYPDGNYIRFSGVRRDESPKRINRKAFEWDNYFECDSWNPIYDWTKQMCFDYVKAHGEVINPLYSLGFNRVGCAPCINSNKLDILRWSQRFPEMIDKIRGWELEVGRTFFAPCIPGKEMNWIDEVVEWAKTTDGELDPLKILAPPSCESKYGLCE